MSRIMPSWVRTLGAILDERNVFITALCSGCGNIKRVDVAKLAAKVGRDYCLINRRSRCGCGGWYRFKYSTGTWTWAMWDELTEWRWNGIRPPPPNMDDPLVRAVVERARADARCAAIMSRPYPDEAGSKE